MKTKLESMFESAYNFINCEDECYYMKNEILEYLCGNRAPHLLQAYKFYKFHFENSTYGDKEMHVMISLDSISTPQHINNLIGESELKDFIKEVKAKMEENMAEITKCK